MSGKKIIIVDTEPVIIEMIQWQLLQDGFEVIVSVSGNEALELVRTHLPDLIILEFHLPGIDGIEVCRQLRKFTNIPIIFISNKSSDSDIILGLGVGGDDYIVKPFSVNQLAARVKALLRRSGLHTMNGIQNQEQTLRIRGLEIDLNSHTVMVHGILHTLSAKEFEILLHLAQNPNHIFPMNELYQLIWGSESLGDTRTLLVHISNLRKKIEQDPADPEYIQTVRGIGYKFNGTLSIL